MAAASTHVLRFEAVTKRFDGEAALTDVSFAVESGERVAIVGPSGAGKTTLLRVANGSLQPDEGRVTLDGQAVSSAEVTLAYGGDTLVDRRTALSNVLSGRVGSLSWWRGLLEPLSPRAPEPALELLDDVGLAAKADARVDELSAGERQRVALARALIRDAPAVLADEPTANLDPSSRAAVLDLLDDTAGDRLLVTALHDTALALDRYDRLVGIADGRIAFDEPADEVDDAALAALFEGDNAATGPGSAGMESASDEPDEPRRSGSDDQRPKEARWYV